MEDRKNKSIGNHEWLAYLGWGEATLIGSIASSWPPEGDPIYENSPYEDNFVVMMILDGTLKPVSQGG